MNLLTELEDNFYDYMREPEYCDECGLRYLSLYPIEFCKSHENLEEA